LVLFLLGIAIGAALLGRLRHRVRSTLVLIGVAQLVTAVLVVAGAAILTAPGLPLSGASKLFVAQLGSFAWQATLIVLPATIVMGLVFPATAQLLGDGHGSEGSDAGSLLAVNTAGSLVGTFVLPFFVIPLIGSPATLAGLALVNTAVGTALLLGEQRLTAGARRVGAVAGAVVAVAVVVAMVSGVAFANPTVAMLNRTGGHVYATAEDEIASVVAGDRNTQPQIWVAGTSMTIITVDTKFMPLIPIALRPNATRGLVIAFGMGTGFRTALNAGVAADVVELVPSVPAMFHWYYPDAAAVLANPKGQVIIADGRNHVELTDRMYDFVIVDPPPPIESSGVSVISTLEFYQAAKARLNPDGVMVQWVPYGQTQTEFLAHVRTFLGAFPNVKVIAGAGGYGFYMIGSDGNVDLTQQELLDVLARPGVLADVDSAPDANNRSAQDWASTLISLTWAQGRQLRDAVGKGPRITDDRPMPEYFLLRRLFRNDPKMLSLKGLRALLK
ncbi:MAG: hypothetical protein WCK58_04320, partial [Chloroflexota bacterium]